MGLAKYGEHDRDDYMYGYENIGFYIGTVAKREIHHGLY